MPIRDAAPPYDLRRETELVTPLIFASPHSGREQPADFLAATDLGPLPLRGSEDALVDRLAEDVTRHGAALLTCRVARAYVDVNRDPRELDPKLIEGPLGADALTDGPRVAAGLGVVPRVVGAGRTIHRDTLTMDEARARIDAVHRPWHAALAALMGEARHQFGVAILIDLHSMPTAARRSRGAAHMVLGDRHGSSCGRALNVAVRTHLETAGYRVALNNPYAGGFVTQSWGRPSEGFHALQIEIDRGLYLDQATLEPTTGFTKVRGEVGRLAEALSGVDWRKALA